MYILAFYLFQSVYSGAMLAIDCRYSAFSGIVTDVTVGGEPLRVQIDFNTPFSRFTADDICPPFVAQCYNRDHARQLTEEEDFLQMRHDDSGRIGGFQMSDELRIGTDFGISRFPFLFTTSILSDSVAGFETAGSIGASKRSQLFQGRIMTVEDTNTGFRMVEVFEDQGIPNARTVRVDSLFEGWVFAGAFASTREDRGFLVPFTAIHFDPAVQDLILPVNFKVSFISNFPTRIEERADGMYIPCTGDEQERIGFALAYKDLIVLEWDQLIVSPEVRSESDDLCLSRIKFSPDKWHMSIGRILTRSVLKIVLDYKKGMIGFGSTDVTRVAFRQPLSLIPVFEYPTIESDRIQFPWLDNLNGLVLFFIASPRLRYPRTTLNRHLGSLFVSSKTIQPPKTFGINLSRRILETLSSVCLRIGEWYGTLMEPDPSLFRSQLHRCWLKSH